MLNTGFSEITQERLNYNDNGFWYCEIAVTYNCNFSCTYCNKLKSEINYNNICEFILNNKNTLHHIQLTGGEPTLYPKLKQLCDFIKKQNIKLGLSTNGSADFEFYKSLNIDMFSISLDDYDIDILKTRGYKNIYKIFTNIIKLSKINYVNIGLVIDNINVNRINDIITYILAMGVNDIKLSINTKDEVFPKFCNINFNKYPILNYRINRFKQGLTMRGLSYNDSSKCYLVKNDISIVGNYHYPCLVYARENGNPIGLLKNNIYQDRLNWFNNHNSNNDIICKKYCMDFKCEFNNEKYKLENKL
ncbi:MAG: radical SAM protein [Candidatus Omnitrophica bacterium]|jgi:hypothetical protein|nr:radical SAM protein [Candidatus Omnitrophota bacterium]